MYVEDAKCGCGNYGYGTRAGCCMSCRKDYKCDYCEMTRLQAKKRKTKKDKVRLEKLQKQSQEFSRSVGNMVSRALGNLANPRYPRY